MNRQNSVIRPDFPHNLGYNVCAPAQSGTFAHLGMADNALVPACFSPRMRIEAAMAAIWQIDVKNAVSFAAERIKFCCPE